MEQNNADMMKRMSLTLMTAIIGGGLFKLMHIPVPWLLGPMAATLIGSNIRRAPYYWPGGIRDAGMMIVGYTIGLSMTPAALYAIGLQIPSMLSMTVLLLLFCAGIAYFVSKFSGNDYSTSLLGSIPGGLTQVILLAEETKGINLAVVTITQVIRLMMIIIFIPLIVMLPVFSDKDASSHSADAANTGSEAAAWSGLFPDVFLFAVVGIVLAYVGSKIRFPTSVLLGPAIGTAVLQAFGIAGPDLPSVIVNLAQLMIGSHVGLMLQVDQIQQKMRTILLAVISGLLLLTVGIVLSVVLTYIQPISNATGLLSMAPGGMDQMGIIAHEIGADLSLVSGYQLFRTFFIYFAVPPLVKLLFKKINKQQKAREDERI